ncbi:glycosyltransferase family 2 protein [Nonomuraea turkmeniaca]|uniref:Glycosyltransferase family 2 protein n=1 Tax=Nonomuraea turkmeniaca TaxID=103838 RepID=A0A5S4FP56_9ACTN|nr:glycosyltransferase [Nonomuraea turkmeniaca]TMR10943.1 glycosyltransferase family 2 protein [Nonomuraea turkmeniaca]
MPPSLSVIVCSYNGAARIGRTLDALAAQTAHADLEIIVVDDASLDGTGDVARGHGVTVIRHETNRGAAAARDTGLRAAKGRVVAFLDDDCEPGPRWAELLLGGYAEEGVAGVGGPIVPVTGDGFLSRFLERNNRHEPLELELTVSAALPYRLWLYLRRQWATAGAACGRRDVYAFSGGNMSFERERLLAAGGFDTRFRYAAEEEDLSRRLRRDRPGRLVFVPDAPVAHRYTPTVRGMLRRSLAYGRGAAMQYLKWPAVRPTVFPWPVLVAGLALAAVLWPAVAVVPVLLPLLLYPVGLRNAVTGRIEALADPYLRIAQEACENAGFLHGLWAFRRMFAEDRTGRGGGQRT